MSNALQFKAEYDPKGKCRKKEFSVGGIVIWGIVALVSLWTGASFIPAGFWAYFH